MNDLLGFAEKMLASHGEFHPFAAYLRIPNEIVHVGLPSDVRWRDDSHRESALIDALAPIAASSLALVFGVATNVSRSDGGEKRDAVRVFLEHRSGYCVDVFFFYALGDDLSVRFGDVAAQAGQQRFFG